MKIEELDITEEDIADAGKRINTVVKRFRETAGPEFYIWKLKYIDDSDVLDSPLTFMIVIALGLALLFNGGYVVAAIYLVVIISALVVIHISRGRILKEKVWKKDYVSNEDILYLCDNRALSIMIHDQVENGVCFTHSSLLEFRCKYIATMRNVIDKKKKNAFLEQIKQRQV